MPSEWIKKCILDVLAYSEPKLLTRRAKTCQVCKFLPNHNCLQISDTKNSIFVLLTNDCISYLEKSGENVHRLKNSIIKLEKYHFSTLFVAGGNRNLNKIISSCSRPFVIQCSQLSLLGAHDSSTIGDPVDINADEEVKRLLAQQSLNHIVLGQRLKMMQFSHCTSLPDSGMELNKDDYFNTVKYPLR